MQVFFLDLFSISLSILNFLFIAVPVLLVVAFFTLLERKILGLVGYRLGPNKARLAGILQPVLDGGKLLNKEINFLSSFYFKFYYLSTISLFFCSLGVICFLQPFFTPFFFKRSLLVFLFILRISSLCSFLSGWSGQRKYSLLGAVRLICQLISYEVLFYIVLFTLIYLNFDLDFQSLFKIGFNLFFFDAPFLFFFWVLSCLAELNRTPFDFIEGESELVRGFNIEFGSGCFTLIFLSEYSNIFFLILVSSLVFFSFNLFFSLFLVFFVV